MCSLYFIYREREKNIIFLAQVCSERTGTEISRKNF